MCQASAILFPNIGFQEILLILLILGLLFGARKLPELGRGLGEGIRNFRKGLRSLNEPEPPEKPGEKNSNSS
ncbi:MAG: twin-arginine translocase TatA/TatE family subunit [Acidobacteria bacterium]|nr:twin-arginine translocase TatA/TatE family subunit [Acidobacteriota bacterium]